MPILMPSLSPTMTEGTIVKWHKKEGDTLSPGDLLCDIQTDKAVVSMDTEEEGILAKIIKPENSKDIQIGVLIAVMVEEGDDWQNAEIPADVGTTPPGEGVTPAPPPPTEATTLQPSGATPAESSNVIGPSVRKLLEEFNIKPGEVTASGPHGNLIKGDVLNYIKTKNLSKIELPPVADVSSSQPASSTYTTSVLPPIDGEEYIDIPNTGMRKTIAKRLTESKTTIPHSYVTIDCNMGNVSKLRKQLAGDGIKVSFNDFIIKASAIALQRVPQVNSVWQGDSVKLSTTVDISVAVATDQGLITPIVQSAAFLSVDDISNKVKDLAARAREGKLKLEEFQGGSFTISNLGMFGISEFSAVINPPQTAILAIGGSQLVLGENGKPETKMTVTLSYDSRVVDESEASQFLEVFQEVMENPRLTIVGSRLSAALAS